MKAMNSWGRCKKGKANYTLPPETTAISGSKIQCYFSLVGRFLEQKIIIKTENIFSLIDSENERKYGDLTKYIFCVIDA